MKTLLAKTQVYTLVKNEARENRLSHAYLLIFNDARNLRFTLKTFAKLLFGCDEPTTNEEKRISDLIDGDNFSDCLIFPAEDKKLSVEDAEKIREESTLSPVEGDKKVFILGDFAEANPQTQNKLLKLLEEPPKGVYFLLGTTSVFPVLSTVLSRTKQLELLSFPVNEVAECLQRIYGNGYDEQTVAICAAASDGNVGQAQNMLEGGHYKALTENAFALALTPLSKLPAIVRTVGETKYKKELLSLLRILFRDSLLIKAQGKKADRHLLLRFERENLEKVATMYELNSLLYAQEALSEAEKQATFNAVFPQCIEICMAKIRAKNKQVQNVP